MNEHRIPHEAKCTDNDKVMSDGWKPDAANLWTTERTLILFQPKFSDWIPAFAGMTI
jgi:hypothetical protein